MATSKSIKIKSGASTVKEVFGYATDVVTPLETAITAAQTAASALTTRVAAIEEDELGGDSLSVAALARITALEDALNPWESESLTVHSTSVWRVARALTAGEYRYQFGQNTHSGGGSVFVPAVTTGFLYSGALHQRGQVSVVVSEYDDCTTTGTKTAGYFFIKVSGTQQHTLVALDFRPIVEGE